MALGYPTSGTRESQQFGPASSSAAGYMSQPAMYGYGASVAFWQPYKGWGFYPHYHNGLDIAGDGGTYLKAMETGKVVYAGWRNNGGGYVVEVEIRPGTRYTFNHCSSILVKVGQIVAKGQNIARIGATGVATGNHCHVSLDIQERGPDGVYRWLMWNPKLWMSGGPYAGDARIRSAYSTTTTRVQRVTVNGNGINIRSAARMTSAALYAHTVSGRFRRYSDNADLGSTTSKLLFYRYVQGDGYVLGGVWGNLYAEVYLGGGHRFIAKPLCSAPVWYSS
jgi:hypothetical protein